MNSVSAILAAPTGLQIRRRGILFVVSAPSGAGKSTLLRGLRGEAEFAYSVSCTTRPPRAGEVDGVDYFFVSPEEFQRRVEAGAFLEHAQVHGHYYGTPRDAIAAQLDRGMDVLLDVDIQGARSIRAQAGPALAEALADVFIMPPSMAELRRRLLARGTEGEAQVALRLAQAEAEMSAWREYRYLLVTGAKEADVRSFLAIMHAERSLARRLEFIP